MEERRDAKGNGSEEGRWRDGMGWTRMGKEGKGGVALRVGTARRKECVTARECISLRYCRRIETLAQPYQNGATVTANCPVANLT